MSQVELQCGPYRVVSLISTEAVTELGLEPGSDRHRRHQGDQRLDRGSALIRTVVALTALAVLSACSPAPATRTTELVVFAASSLSDTYTTLGTTFEAAHPGVTVKFSFDGSSTLVDQLTQGAPADVFASADRTTMTKATTANLISGTPSACSRRTP